MSTTTITEDVQASTEESEHVLACTKEFQAKVKGHLALQDRQAKSILDSIYGPSGLMAWFQKLADAGVKPTSLFTKADGRKYELVSEVSRVHKAFGPTQPEGVKVWEAIVRLSSKALTPEARSEALATLATKASTDQIKAAREAVKAASALAPKKDAPKDETPDAPGGEPVTTRGIIPQAEAAPVWDASAVADLAATLNSLCAFLQGGGTVESDDVRKSLVKSAGFVIKSLHGR
jgi:hypothetical protein